MLETIKFFSDRISHSGSSSSSGHYTACCLTDNGKNYFFNDQNVDEIDNLFNYSGDPYILFYKRGEQENDPKNNFSVNNNNYDENNKYVNNNDVIYYDANNSDANNYDDNIYDFNNRYINNYDNNYHDVYNFDLNNDSYFYANYFYMYY